MTITDRAVLRQRLIALLDAEREQVEAFVVLLEEERTVLGQREVEPLFAIAERKNALARTLQQFADNRAALLAQAGQQSSREGIEALLANPAHPSWQAYLSQVKLARDLNSDNGIRITEQLSSNHQALAMLMSLSDRPTTYGPDGQTSTRPGSRLFGSV
ncbi:MAG: flagellar protein FlgN [Moraxellaceae bacterium]|nr:flagellar protein FlgN [Moraxellaceae bacterium]